MVHGRSLTKRIAMGTFWVSMETWGGQLLQFAIFVVLSRLLGPEAYGLMGLALLINLCAEVLIVSGGWGDAIVHRADLTREHEASIFYFLLGLSGVLALLVIGLAAPAGRLFDAGELAVIMPWLALQLPISALAVVPRGLLRRKMDFAPLVVRSLAANAVGGGLAVALAAAGAGVWSLVVFQLVRPAASAAVIWTATGWRPPAAFSLQALKDVLPFVGGALGDRTVAVGDAILMRTVIGLALGPLALGLYTFAGRISDLLLHLVTRPLARVLLPSASRLRPDDARLPELVAGAAALSGLILFPVAAGLAIVAPELVPLVFGQTWTPAVPLLQALMFVTAAAPFAQITTSVIYSSGGARQQFALSVLATIVLCALLLLYGTADLATMAAALVTRAAIMLPIRMLVARHATGLDIPRLCTRALRPLAATAAMTGVLLLVREFGLVGLPPATRLALSVLTGVLVYAALAAVLARRAVNRAITLVSALRA